MRMLTTLAFVVLPSVAAAEVRVGSLATIAPVMPETASLGGWIAGDFGPVYLGGEIAIETIDVIEGDVGISYHALVGHRHALSKRVHLLVDGGVGVTQEEKTTLGFGSRGFSDTVGVIPSGAVRAQLAFELFHLAGAAFAIGVGSEARGAVDSNESAGGIAVGLAVVVSGASEGR
jgi:hypothetical protein